MPWSSLPPVRLTKSMSGLWGQNSWGWGGGRGKGKGNGRGWGYQGNAGWGSFQQGASYGGGRGAGGGLGFGGVARQFQGMCEDMNAMACMAQVGQALNGLSAGGGTTPVSSGAGSPAKEPEALTESAVEKAVKKAIADSPSKDDEARLRALAGRWSITSGENTPKKEKDSEEEFLTKSSLNEALEQCTSFKRLKSEMGEGIRKVEMNVQSLRGEVMASNEKVLEQLAKMNTGPHGGGSAGPGPHGGGSVGPGPRGRPGGRGGGSSLPLAEVLPFADVGDDELEMNLGERAAGEIGVTVSPDVLLETLLPNAGAVGALKVGEEQLKAMAAPLGISVERLKSKVDVVSAPVPLDEWWNGVKSLKGKSQWETKLGSLGMSDDLVAEVITDSGVSGRAVAAWLIAGGWMPVAAGVPSLRGRSPRAPVAWA